MEQSNEHPCQWDNCANRASKRVTYDRQTGEVENEGNVGRFPIKWTEADLCELHISEARKHYSDVGEVEEYSE